MKQNEVPWGRITIYLCLQSARATPKVDEAHS